MGEVTDSDQPAQHDHDALPDQPGPRDALDEGTMSDLRADSAEVPVDAGPDQPVEPGDAGAFPPIDVPDDARGMVEGLPSYGS